MRYGYLGVDVFLVISGYLLFKSLIVKIHNGTFRYFDYILNKLVRLWPLVLLASFVSLIVFYYYMLPDDYENLSESVFASSLFANNILQSVTTKNYWNTANTFKPLMHLWYVGVLMQAYVVIPPIFIICKRVFKNFYLAAKWLTLSITGISLILYILPNISASFKFYYLPFRMFEITAGGMITFLPNKASDSNRVMAAGAFLAVGFLLFSNCRIISDCFMLLSIVCATAILIYSIEDHSFSEHRVNILNFIASLGERSYSIYIWHQLVVALLLYSFFDRLTVYNSIVFCVTAVIVAFLSYEYIEKCLNYIAKNRNKRKMMVALCSIFAIFLCCVSLHLYLRAGVVRDVPELDVHKGSEHRNMHAEYCDRPYQWDEDFIDNGKINMLVIGNSFGRDWANILFEYDNKESFNISYIYYEKDSLSNYDMRINDSDYVFFALGPKVTDGVPAEVTSIIPEEKLYIVGNKKFGYSNGIIYANRNKDDYYEQVVKIDNSFLLENKNYSDIYGDHYIDMLSPVLSSENYIRVFTDNNKFISQDCSHLTRAGAQYYSRILDIGGILESGDI